MKQFSPLIWITILFAFPSKKEFSEAFIEVASNGNPAVVSIISEKVIEQRSLLSYLSTEEIKSLWQGLTKSLNTLVVVKSKNQFDIRRLKSEEQRVINSLMVLNIDLIKLSVKQRQDENYQQALDGLIAKLNEYYKSELENNPEMTEELQSLKQIVLRPNNETINQAIEEIQRLRKA